MVLVGVGRARRVFRMQEAVARRRRRGDVGERCGRRRVSGGVGEVVRWVAIWGN